MRSQIFDVLVGGPTATNARQQHTTPQEARERMNETTPLLNDGNGTVIQQGTNDEPTSSSSSSSLLCASSKSHSKLEEESNNVVDVEVGTSAQSTTNTVATPEIVPGSDTDGLVTKQQNVPIVELLAITAFISGSLSMYWGITGIMMVGTTTAATMSVILTTLLSQPIIIVHIIMSTCVVVLAPVVTVQKVQLSALGTLREQQNELRTQINAFNQMNDELTKSVASIEDETEKIEQVNNELQIYAKSAGTTADRLVELCQEQQDINTEMQQHLQAKVLQQIVTITLQSDTNQNYIVSENEMNVLIERLQQIPGVIFHVEAFRHILNQSEPQGSLTMTDICRIARNMQWNANKATTTNAVVVSDESIQYGDPVFVFQPNDTQLPQK